MRNRNTVVAAILAALLVTACAHSRSAPAEYEPHRLDQRQSEFFAAVAARDADATASFFSDSAVVHAANMPAIVGRAAIHRFYDNLFRFLRASTATPDELQLSAGGDMAYGTGRTSNEFQAPQGRTEYSGKYVLVWRRLADRWMIVHFGVSSDQPQAQ
jgi:ketosteroid isomerase-like protein